MEKMSAELDLPMRAAANSDEQSTPRAGKKSRRRRIAAALAVYSIIIAATLFVIDRALIALRLFPPAYDYGHPVVGWLPTDPTGKMMEQGCLVLHTKETIRFTRNEDGLRTHFPAQQLRQNNDLFKVAVSGDSHTELCVTNDQNHFGVMERELNSLGLQSGVFAFGAGKYSPLQAYLAIRESMNNYSADAFVLNLYTGNDFYDMLRVDDRPYFKPGPDGYILADPVWYQLDSPHKKRESRVLFLLESAYKKTGLHRVVLRLHYLKDVAAQQNAGVGSVFGYMNDLRKSASKEIEYSHAFSAQMLNQQLFFHHFPGSREESVRRVKALLDLVRQQNPGRLLIMSPIPSYQLVNAKPVDRTFLDVFDRLPIEYEAGVTEEAELYAALKQMSTEAGWVFVDNLPPLRAYSGEKPLFNRADYHIEPVASEIIGKAQAREIVNRVKPPTASVN